MSYVALYRKFRPQSFDQVKGQDHVVQTLKNQLIYHRIGHAYLFTGTRGTGKTSAAKIFAKAVNCLHPVDGEPCNECENCRSANAGNFVDIVEVDAASNNGVDDIRRIIEEVRYTPVKGAYKVYIIDEAHMITGPAFNAFLKTLEEPPAYAVFILATTEPHKLPITILSRCQRYDFRRIRTEEIAGNLMEIVRQEGVDAEERAVSYIARAGDGSMRDAISLLDKCIAFHLGQKLTYESVLNTLGSVDTAIFSQLLHSVSAGDAASALQIVDGAVAEGKDLTQFATDFIWYIRNVLMVRAARLRDPEMLGISEENMEQLIRDAESAEEGMLIRYIRILSELVNQIRFSSTKQILLEVGMIKLAKPQMETDTESLADRIRQLELSVASGAVGAMKPSQPRPAVQELRKVPEAASVAPAPTPTGAYEEEDDFFAGLGMSGMKNPDVFADFLGNDPAPEAPSQTPLPQKSAPSQAPQNAGSQQSIWPQIVALCDNPRIRFTLNKCTAERISEDQIRIYAPNEFVMKQLREESVVNYVRQLAGQALGRAMDLQVAPASAAPSQPAGQEQFPENVLKNINFNIGTEEY